MKKISLKVDSRKIVGKKVKKLRREGTLPANVYGRDIKSESVQVAFKEFEKVYKEAGETGLVELQLDGQVRPVLIHNIQFDPVTHEPLHADFYQVNLKEKVKTMVPLSFIGEPAAVTNKVGILLEQMSEVEVEALPTDLPENIEVNVESLANVDEQITVGQLKLPQGVTVLTDPNLAVVKIGELVTKEAQEQAAAEAAAAEAAKAAEAPAEGEAPAAEGEKPVEEQPAEESAQTKEQPAEDLPAGKAGKPQ